MRANYYKNTLFLGFLFVFLLGINGCFSTEKPTLISPVESDTAGGPPLLVDPFKAVCDPMGSIVPKPMLAKGLVADLYNLTPSQESHIQRASDFQVQGKKLDVRLFFTQLFIPTRRFDRGFITQKGDAIKNSNGGSLDEWFGLHIESTIGLSAEKKPGFYQFALLADDGATLKVDQGNGFELLVDNDGAHEARLTCAKKGITLDPKNKLPIQVDFFQGPRYHLALALLYRPIPSETVPPETTCGAIGNELFFDSTQTPSVPTDTWRELLKRGWKVVPADEFYLPKEVGANPCAIQRFNIFRK